jgi:hypothetical protein
MKKQRWFGLIFVLCLVAFLTQGCVTTPPNANNGMDVNADETSEAEKLVSRAGITTRWKFEYVEPCTAVDTAFSKGGRNSSTMPYDGVAISNNKHGLVSDTLFIANKKGNYLATVGKSGTTGVRAFFGGMGKMATGVPAAATLGVLQKEAAIHRAKDNVSAGGGDGGSSSSTATATSP